MCRSMGNDIESCSTTSFHKYESSKDFNSNSCFRHFCILYTYAILSEYRQRLVYFKINTSLCISDCFIIIGQCVSTSAVYKVFNNIFNAVLSGILIPVLMIIFSTLTVQNVKRLRQRVHHNTPLNLANITNKKYESQLLSMILAQQLVYIICNLPFVSYSLYIQYLQ